MYVYESDWFTQYGPVKHWVHCKSTSHSPPPNQPVSATESYLYVIEHIEVADEFKNHIFNAIFLNETQCFFKFFKRVSWWSFRVSTPFSLSYLILLAYFHKNPSFSPIMLNYLNTTLTFGKQTEDNFINRKVQCRPTHSFICSFSCQLFLWGESRGQQP